MHAAIIHPPVASMAIALREEIQHWGQRAIELLPQAEQFHQERQREIWEETMAAATSDAERAEINARWRIKPFPHSELTVAPFAITLVDATDILKELFRSWISERCCFEKSSYTGLDQVLGDRFSWYTSISGESDYLTGMFFAEIIDPVYLEIHDLLSPHIAADTWDVWSVISVNRNNFTVKNDGDFRVLEWQQLVDSGVIDCPIRSKAQQRISTLRTLVNDKLPHADWENAFDETGAPVFAGSRRYVGAALIGMYDKARSGSEE